MIAGSKRRKAKAAAEAAQWTLVREVDEDSVS